MGVGNYSHLYNSGIYIPPSVERKMQIATPNNNLIYGDLPNVNRGSTLDSVTGVNAMNRLFNHELTNKEVYKSMKNKIMYSTSQDVSEHMRLNRL